MTGAGRGRLTRGQLLVAGGTAIVLGAAMTLSPVTVIAAAVLTCIVAVAVHGRTGLERRLLIAVLAAAIGVRVALVLWLFVSSDYFSQGMTSFAFDGDGVFMKARSLWMRNIWLDVPIDPHNFTITFGSYGQTSYVEFIAYIQYLLGPAPYAIHLFNVACSLTGAVLIHRVVRPSFGVLAALLALVLMLFLPTMLLWSASALKESLYFLLTSSVIYGLAGAARPGRVVWRVGALAVAVVAALLIGPVRAGALVIVAGGVGVAVAGTLLTRRLYLLAAIFMLTAAAGYQVLQLPSVQSRVMSALVVSANIHVGHVNTRGYSYRVLDRTFYTGRPLSTMTGVEATRYVVRALLKLVLVPLPHEMESRSQLVFLPQQVLWYGLVALALPGAIVGLRRDPFLTWLLVGLIAVGGGVIALNSGNVGTMVRLRDSIVPMVVCLAALGAVSLPAAWCGNRTRETGSMRSNVAG
jgi:hypothetical protein